MSGGKGVEGAGSEGGRPRRSLLPTTTAGWWAVGLMVGAVVSAVFAGGAITGQ